MRFYWNECCADCSLTRCQIYQNTSLASFIQCETVGNWVIGFSNVPFENLTENSWKKLFLSKNEQSSPRYSFLFLFTKNTPIQATIHPPHITSKLNFYTQLSVYLKKVIQLTINQLLQVSEQIFDKVKIVLIHNHFSLLFFISLHSVFIFFKSIPQRQIKMSCFKAFSLTFFLPAPSLNPSQFSITF